MTFLCGASHSVQKWFNFLQCIIGNGWTWTLKKVWYGTYLHYTSQISSRPNFGTLNGSVNWTKTRFALALNTVKIRTNLIEAQTEQLNSLVFIICYISDVEIMQQMCWQSFGIHSFKRAVKLINKWKRMSTPDCVLSGKRGWKGAPLRKSAFLEKRALLMFSREKNFIFLFWMSSTIRPVSVDNRSRISNDKMTLKPFVNVVRPSSQFPKDDDILFERWKRRQQIEKSANIRYLLYKYWQLVFLIGREKWKRYEVRFAFLQHLKIINKMLNICDITSSVLLN